MKEVPRSICERAHRNSAGRETRQMGHGHRDGTKPCGKAEGVRKRIRGRDWDQDLIKMRNQELREQEKGLRSGGGNWDTKAIL